MRSMARSSAMAVPVCLLSRLPALKTLDIETFDRTDDDEWAGSGPPGDPFMASLNQLILLACDSPAFQTIETAKVLVPVPYDEPENGFDFYVYAETVLPLFYLPRIRNVELHRVDGRREEAAFLARPGRSLRDGSHGIGTEQVPDLRRKRRPDDPSLPGTFGGATSGTIWTGIIANRLPRGGGRSRPRSSSILRAGRGV
ncbi:hypothetical protein LZ31DRAFT_557001 [Colletotrichum somersetense]|nr:hypothetical protein LZ31DRAFT_557001 [Colletotrichum somersetense]